MKILGLIGGTSWVSTADYYKLINEGVNEKLGDLNFSECMIYSLNYQVIRQNIDIDDWDKNLEIIADAAIKLQNVGAKAIVLCANTMHLIADRLQERIQLPIIHIATATANEIRSKGMKKVGMLGTRLTMERDFFRTKLAEQGIEMLIPEDDDRGFIHYTIFEELGRGIFTWETKQRYLAIMQKLIAAGAEGIIAGCTEIPMLIKQDEVAFQMFDTMDLHAKAAVEFAVS
jgi:aspartate racemase